MEPLHCASGEYLALQYDVIFTQISMLTKVSNPVVVYEARVVESFYSDFLLILFVESMGYADFKTGSPIS